MKENVLGLAILGLGTAVPEYSMSQTEAAAMAREITCQDAEQEEIVDLLYDRSGVDRRHTVLPHRTAMRWVSRGEGDAPTLIATDGPTTRERMEFYEEYAGPLAIDSARRALDDASLDAGQIRHLVTISCTGFFAPGIDRALIDGLGLSPRVERTQVGFMGCHAAINGLRAARGLAAAEPGAHVLACSVELCSIHYHFRWAPLQVVGNALFADGSAAVVGRLAEGAPPWRVTACGSSVLPNSRGAMRWEIGDYGFEMHLGRKVPALIREHLGDWLIGWLAARHLRLEDVGCWAIHPGGPKILDAVEESLGLKPDQTDVARQVLRDYGNMSSATVLFLIERLRREGRPLPCVALAFGPGLTAEVALLE